LKNRLKLYVIKNTRNTRCILVFFIENNLNIIAMKEFLKVLKITYANNKVIKFYMMYNLQ